MSLSRLPVRRALALCAGVSTFAGADAYAAGAPAAVPPSDDVYVTAKKRDRNFGASRYLIVRRAPATRSFLRFRFEAHRAPGFRATLRVYPLTSSRTGLRVRAAGAGWSEPSLTFRSLPSTERAVVRSGALRARRWKDIDVTRLVRGGGAVSLALATSAHERIVLASRESGARGPRLLLRNARGVESVAVPPAAPSPAPAPSSEPARVPTPPVPVPAPSPEAVVAAAGDIASSGYGDEATASLLDTLNPDAVLTLGDNAYTSGSPSEFSSFYQPTWGRHRAKTKPAVGNHEYKTAGAAGFFDYFGPLAGQRGQAYYSFDLAGWHIVALNSNIERTAGSPQETWLRNDLARNSSRCVLAYWHHPRWNIGTKGDDATQAALWNALYDHGADVVLVGHDHNYQRYYRLDKNGARDDARGIRQFTVGTGGVGHYGVTARAPAETVNADTYGVLRLTLRPGAYDWRFLPEAGKTFTDAGSESCH